MGSTFITDHLATLGADFAVKKMQLEDESTLELQIWDLAGQPGFENLRQRFFLGATSAFMIFDLCSRDSFLELDNWMEQFWKAHPNKNLPIAIIGNKVDLENHEITDNEVAAYISKIKADNNIPDTFIKYYKTSAKTGENIEECFIEVAKEIIDIVTKDE